MLVEDILHEAKEILGRCKDEVIFQRLTLAIERLSTLGHWSPLLGYVDIKSCDDESKKGALISLPSEIETPLAVSVGGVPRYFRNIWADFHLNGDGMHEPVVYSWDDKGFYPLAVDLKDAANLLWLVDNKNDLDESIRVVGFDADNRPLREQTPDGTWREGIVLPAALYSASPTIPTTREFSRIFSVPDLTTMTSLTDHQLTTGALVEYNLTAGPNADPLIDGSFYFVRVRDNDTVSLFATREDALADANPIKINAADPATQFTLTDRRGFATLTKFNSVTNLNFDTGTVVSFTGSPLPVPLDSTTNYYARVLDPNNFTVHLTEQNAALNVEPVDVRTPGTSVIAQAKQDLKPYSELEFSVPHNFTTQDTVKAVNSSGQLPAPLFEGVDYYVYVVSSTRISLHSNLTDALTGTNPIVLTSPGSGSSRIVKITTAAIGIGNSNNCTAVGHGLNTALPSIKTSDRSRTANVATITLQSPHGVPIGNVFTVTIADVTNVAAGNYNGLGITATSTGASTFTYPNPGTDEPVVADIGGLAHREPFIYPAVPPPPPPPITDFPAGAFIQFETTGILPSPLSQGTVYVARDPSTADTFTISTTAYENVNITDLGTGSHSLVISRTFSPAFLDIWVTDSTFLTDGAAVKVDTTGTLPTTAPGLVLGTDYYVKVLIPGDPGVVELYTDPGLTTKVTVSAFGTGDLFLVVERPVTAELDSNRVRIDPFDYLEDGVTVQLETTGTLPAPLATGTDYTIQKSAAPEFIQFVDTVGPTVVTLTDIGDGFHNFIIQRNFNVDLGQALNVTQNVYNDGDAVVVSSDDTLPAPFVDGTTYYVRKLTEDTIELYDTAANAQNAPSIVGLIAPTTTGEGTHLLTQTLPAHDVGRITRIEKPLTQGRSYMFSNDPGQTLPVTNHGTYEDDDTDPAFRRIRIHSKCDWVRMMYHRKPLIVRSLKDFIPIKNRMAILMMLRSQELLRTNYFQESEAYEAKAKQFLEDEDEIKSGPDTVHLQINEDIWTGAYEDHIQ